MLKENEISHYLNLKGTIRSQTVQNTLQWLKSLLEPLGITRVANVTGLDCLGIPVAISIRPNSKHLAVSQGKGFSYELAMASAIMESAEGFHVENAKPPVLYGAYSELRKYHPILDPKMINPGAFTLTNLENWRMGWTYAQAIQAANQQPVLIPQALTCLNSTQTHPEYSFFSVSSNGLAAGNTYHEALCHSLYEIIERDSLFRWSQQADDVINQTQVKLETITSELNQTLLLNFKKAKQLIKIWDITSSLGIPSFHCVIKDSSLRGLGMFRGTGTHLSKEIALSRALTEAAQSRLTLISGTRDDVFTDQYSNRGSYVYSELEYTGSHSYEECEQPPIQADFEVNSTFLCNQLLKHGFPQILIFDHTRADLKIPVVQTFIPGLQYNGSRI